MARMPTPGAVRFTRSQKDAFATVRALLDFGQKELAAAMKWDASSLSSAISSNVNSDKTRSIDPNRLKHLEAFLRTRFAEHRDSLTEANIGAIEESFDRLFPYKVDGAVGPRLADPGEVMLAESANRIEPNWEQALLDYVVGRGGAAPPPRVWVLGGPKSGKTVTIKRVEALAEEKGLEVVAIDLRNLAENFHPSGDERNIQSQILEQILQLAFQTSDRLGSTNTSSAVLVTRFIDQLKERLWARAGGRRLVVTLDHLYLFGPQNGNAGFGRSFDDIHLTILTSLRNFNIPLSTIFIVDDGSATANPNCTSYWSKGKHLKCSGDLDTLNAVWEVNNPDDSENAEANAIWAAKGVGLVNPETSIHLDQLGGSIFLHHAAARLAATQKTLCEMSAACRAVVAAVARAEPTPDDGITEQLKSFRRRVVGWLRLKAEHCGLDYSALCRALVESEQGLRISELSSGAAVELDVALELGGFYGNPRIPSGFLRELARAEASGLALGVNE